MGKKGGGALSGRGEARTGQIGRGSGGGEGTSTRGCGAPRRRIHPGDGETGGGETMATRTSGGGGLYFLQRGDEEEEQREGSFAIFQNSRGLTESKISR